MAASKSAGFTLTSSLLASTDLMSLSLSNGITTANLTDNGSGGNTFTVSGWTGGGTLKGATETLVDNITSNVTLSNTSLAVTGRATLTLSGFTTANLTDTAGGNTFTVSGWTRAGSLMDNTANADTVAATKAANYTLTNTSLASGDGMSLGLTRITVANLAVTGAGHTFTESGWTGSGSLTGTTATVAASNASGFTLSPTSLTAGPMSLTLSGITTANLTDTSSGGNTFTVTGWTGGGKLSGTSETLVDSASASMTLANSSLAVTSQPTLSLNGFTVADLTVTANSGQPSYILDASAFSDGPTNLTASGTVNAILYGGTAGNDTLTVASSGSGNNILIGNGASDTLTDNGTGGNILIGAGAGGDTITGNGNDILISGTTKYDSDTAAHIAALDAILAEWTSADNYATRISKIMSGVGPGNADKLNSSTITRDANANTLSDGASQPQNNNWFLSWPSDIVHKNAGETDTTI